MAVIGIDLGTSNTCVAVVVGGRPQVILDEKRRSTMPSVMSLNRKGQFFVGHLAKAQMSIHPELTIHSAKRLVGQRFDSEAVQRLLPHMTYRVVPLSDGMPGLMIGEQFLTPVEVSAAVLKRIKALAESALGEEVNQAVISVPAHFDNIQRTSTKQAAELAGLEVLRLINEPTAAALAYGYGGERTHNVAVYDLGGGTFDISVLELGDGIYNVLATGGDTFLGGNDFNQVLAEWVMSRFATRTGIDLTPHLLARQRILDAVEYAKIQLSNVTQTMIELPNIVPDVDPSLSIEEVLTRQKVEQMCIPLVERTLAICHQVFESSGVRREDLDEVVLVGGMTRMPLVRRMVESWFGRVPNTRVNPDEVVGIGAAIQAMALVTHSDKVLLLDVVPLTLGIEAAGGVFIPLIRKGTKVPHRVSRIFTTNRNDQESVIISVFQGESSISRENTLLATFELSGIRQAKRMEPRIEVSLHINVSGILSVTAIDLDTQRSQTVEVVDMTMRAIRSLDEENFRLFQG